MNELEEERKIGFEKEEEYQQKIEEIEKEWFDKIKRI